MIVLAEIVDKLPSVADAVAFSSLLALLSAGLALIRWWAGAFVCLCSCVMLLLGAYHDLADSTLRPLIYGELGVHYLWARLLASAVPLLAAPVIARAWKRQRTQSRRRAGGCVCCGYFLGPPGATACPECGSTVAGRSNVSSVTPCESDAVRQTR